MKGVQIRNNITCSELVRIMHQLINLDMLDIQENMKTNVNSTWNKPIYVT